MDPFLQVYKSQQKLRDGHRSGRNGCSPEALCECGGFRTVRGVHVPWRHDLTGLNEFVLDPGWKKVGTPSVKGVKVKEFTRRGGGGHYNSLSVTYN